MSVYEEIKHERWRVHGHRQPGQWLADDPECPDILRLAALVEECGEVARAVHDGSDELRAELIQLAGVAAGWAEALNA